MTSICFYHWHLVFPFHLSILSYLLSSINRKNCTFVRKIKDYIRHHSLSFIPVYSFKYWNMKIMHSKILQEIWSVYLIHFLSMINWCQKSIKKKIVFTDIFNLFLFLFYKLYSIFELKKSYTENGKINHIFILLGIDYRFHLLF